MYSFFKPHYGFKASMESLLTSLKSQGVIHSDKVFNAMLKVDRADFCKEEPYWDR
jgi:protein-L-isoaspartate O-methyltransferase